MSSFSRGYFNLQIDSRQPLDHVLLVKDGQLHCDPRQILKVGRGIYRPVFLVFVIEINQDVAMHAICGKQNKHNEIGNEQGAVKRIGVVKALKGLVQQMLAEIPADAFRGSRGGQCRRKDEMTEQQDVSGENSILPDRLPPPKSRLQCRLFHGSINH